MAGQTAGNSRCCGADRRTERAQHGCELFGSHATRPQDIRPAVREIDDRRFDAHGARTAIEDQIDQSVQLGEYVLGRGRADSAKAIGRRSRDSAANQAEQFLCDRMSWHTQADRSEPARDQVARARSAPQNHRERPGPKGIGEGFRLGRDVGCPLAELPGRCQMHNDRVVGGAALRREHRTHCRGIFGGSAQAVDRFRRKRNQPPRSQRVSREVQRFRRRTQNS